MIVWSDGSSAAFPGRIDSDREPAGEGPHVAKLREVIAEETARGLIDWHMSWGEGAENLSPDERARAVLAFDWAAKRHSYRVKVIDPIIGWQFSVHTWKRSFYIRWRHIPAWIGDRWREAGMRLRVLSDRARGIRNPYLAKPGAPS